MAAAVQLIPQFAATIPAGTPVAAPVTVPMVLPTLEVVWIEWEVPPGPRGNVGFWIGSLGTPVIPFNNVANPWIITDNRAAHWDLAGQMDSGEWELVGYNVDVNPHTITVRFGLAPPAPPVQVAPAMLPASILSGTLPGA